MSNTPLYTSGQPVFDKEKITLIFILGGPGAGKGTQCELMVKDYGFKHISAGDLLREEQDRPGSKYGDLIRQYIKDGLIVPSEITIKLLENAMQATLDNPPSFPEGSKLANGWKDGKGLFLIDGFPRKMDQAILFDEAVVHCSLVLFLETSEDTMIDRILERSKTSGRADDNRESLTKRFVTFRETSMPVVEYYRKLNLCENVDASHDIPVVYEGIKKVLAKRFPHILE